MTVDPFGCFIKVLIDGREEECGRERSKNTDLCCADHWALVPRSLKQPFIDANKERSLRERERKTIDAADAIVRFLKAKKIQLPPRQKLLRPGALDLRPGPLVKVDPGPVVTAEKKLIITGR